MIIDDFQNDYLEESASHPLPLKEGVPQVKDMSFIILNAELD